MTDTRPAPALQAYRAETPWGPLSAALVTLFAGLVLPTLVGVIGMTMAGDLGTADLPPLSSPSVLAQMIVGQLLSLGVIWLAAGYKGARGAVLRLTPPKPGWGLSAGLGLLLAAITSPLEILFYRLAGLNLFTDAQWLIEGLRSPLWWGAVLAAVVMAPLWEEVTFRGFLLSALAKTRLGYWPSALLSTACWTALHMGYSWPGLASVFMAGIGLSAIMWITGSLRAVVVAHAVLNTIALLTGYLFAPVG
jgi:hypothetical protein